MLTEIKSAIIEACQLNPNKLCMVSPPMYRTTPDLYHDSISEVMIRFSDVFSNERLSNLSILPLFPTPTLKSDGVHLTPISGLEYILFLQLRLLGVQRRPFHQLQLRTLRLSGVSRIGSSWAGQVWSGQGVWGQVGGRRRVSWISREPSPRRPLFDFGLTERSLLLVFPCKSSRWRWNRMLVV